MALWHKGVKMAAGKMPKVIGPTTHAVLDYAVAGSFLLMGILFWKRNKRAAVGSLVCGSAAAANILLTDYPGGSQKLLGYKAHGHVETGIAGMTAAMPRLLKFEDEPEAKFFELEALAKTVIISLTDYDSYDQRSQKQLREVDEQAEALDDAAS